MPYKLGNLYGKASLLLILYLLPARKALQFYIIIIMRKIRIGKTERKRLVDLLAKQIRCLLIQYKTSPLLWHCRLKHIASVIEFYSCDGLILLEKLSGDQFLSGAIPLVCW